MASRSRKQPPLSDLDQAELDLFHREKETSEYLKRIAEERVERETMIPPMEEIQIREREREHEVAVSRGEIANVRREHTRSLLVLILLIAAICTTLWWAISMMRGN